MGRTTSSVNNGDSKLSNASLGDDNDVPLTVRLREALFTVFMQMNKDTSIYHLIVILYFIVDGLQLLSFPFNQNPHMPFGTMPVARSIFTVLGTVTFLPSPLNGPINIYATDIMYIITIVFVILNLLLLGYSVWLYVQRDDFINGITVYRPHWPIRALRTCARISTLALFVDIVSILLMPFDCPMGTWGNSYFVCWTGTHILFVVLSIIFLPLFFVYAILVAGMYIDRRPDPKRNLLSQAHGRIAVVMILLKTILSIVFVFGSHASTDNWFLYFVALFVGLAWLILYARFLPYHQSWLNELQCSIAGIYTAAAIAGLLAHSLRDPEHSVGAWVWLFTAPLAAFVGWAIAYASRRTYGNRRELGSPFMVEIKARAMINELTENESIVDGSSYLAATDQRNHGGKDNRSNELNILVPEKDVRLRDIQILYDDALIAFTGSSILELFIATFLGYVRRNRHLELLHLRAADAKADTSAIDIRFFVWERLALIDEEETSSNTVKTSVLRRLQFDKLQSESENLSMKARGLILDFWTESCEKLPDMARMQTFGTDIIATIRQGDNIFRQLMEMAPQSTAVMRSYADFLLDIANDPRKALELLQAAEQIEEDESKAHATNESDTKEYPFMMMAPDFDLSNENVALIRISGEQGRLGIVTDANPAALKLFGYGRRELIGKNIDVLVPEPVATVHQKFLEKYMETGEETVVNTSRIYFGLHRNGNVFPMSANIRPMEGGFGGVLEEIITSQGNIVFCGDWGRWKVTSVCKMSMALLGITVNDLKVGNVIIDKLISGIVPTGKHQKFLLTDDDNHLTPSSSLHDTTDNHHRSYSGGTKRETTISHRTQVMNDLINASTSPGPGVDISFNVIQWGAAAAALARSQRRKAHNVHTGSTIPSIDEVKEQDRFAAATAIIKQVQATAKLQEVAIPFLPGPCYFLRWRVAKGTDTSDALPPLKSIDSDDNDGSTIGSNDAENSDNEVSSNDDDDNDGVHSPLLTKGKTGFGAKIRSPKAFSSLSSPSSPSGLSHTTGTKKGLSTRVIPDKISSDVDDIDHTDRAPSGFNPIGANGLPSNPPELTERTNTTASEHQRRLKSALSHHRLAGNGKGEDGEVIMHKTHSITWDTTADTNHTYNNNASTYSTTDNNDANTEVSSIVKEPTPSEPMNLPNPDIISKGDDLMGEMKKPGGSVHSGSSAGSSAITDAVRKGITQRSRTMEASLVRLRRSLITIFIFVGFMNIASLIVTHVLYSTLQGALELVAANGRRGIALQRAYSELQRLRMMADGSLITYDNGTATRVRLEAALNDLADVHQYLYSYVDETDVDERTLYSSPTITVQDFVVGSYVTRSNYQSTNRTINLMNAGLEFIAKARQVVARNDVYVNEFNESSGSMFWLLSNGPVSIRNAFNASMLIADNKTNGVSTTIMLANMIVLGIALGLLVLVTGVVMAPSIYAVLVQKASVFTVFLETPLPILRSLRARTETKISALRRANEEADAGLDVAGAGEADEEEIEREAAAMATTAVITSVNAETKGKHSSKHSRRHDKRTFKRTTTVGVATTLRFAWPMVFLAAYYIGTYFWKQQTAYEAEYATSEVFFSHQVEFFVGQSNFNARNALTFCDPGFVRDQYQRFDRLMGILEMEQDALLYGSETLHVRSLLKESSAHFKLFMQDGCIDNNDELYTMDSCRNTFFDGLVGKGLQGTYKQYVELAKRKMEERLVASQDPSTCVRHTVNTGIPIILENLAERYLSVGFHASAQYTLDNINSFLDTFKIVNIVVTVASILALTIFFFVVYQPMIRRMDTEIKNVRFLLLLFPDEISRIVPAIIAAGRDLLKEGHYSSASSVASGSSGVGGGSVKKIGNGNGKK